MKKKIIGFCFLCVLIFCCSIIYFNYFSFLSKTNDANNVNISSLNNGDLILRCGRSTESYAVYLADSNTEFTHIGIVSLENGVPYVIHAVPHKNDFIKKEIISQFLEPKQAAKFAIYRTSFPSEILNDVVKEAQNFYIKKYTFDDEYNLNTNSKLYCTELILKAFSNVGLSLNIKSKKLNYVVWKHNIIFPSEFTKPPVFRRII